MDFQNISNGFALSPLGWDVLVVFVFVFALFLYIFRLGRDRALVMLVCTYISWALASNLDLFMKAGGVVFELDFVYVGAIFLFLIFILSFAVSNSPLTSVFDQGPKGSWFQVMVVGFLQIGLMFSIIFSFLPILDADSFSIFVKSFFIDDVAKVFWVISPFLVITLIK